MTVQEAKVKLYRYCVYQERCHQEVQQKLLELGIQGDEADELTSHLIAEGFLSEERFARNFSNGKFRLKHWGRLKIKRELELRNLSKSCINLGLSEIKEDEYIQSLTNLLTKKALLSDKSNLFVLRDKLSKFAIHKGFEPSLVWDVLYSLAI